MITDASVYGVSTRLANLPFHAKSDFGGYLEILPYVWGETT